jgi:hypothetical protein
VEPRLLGPTAGPVSYPGTKVQVNNVAATPSSGSHQPPGKIRASAEVVLRAWHGR